LIGTTVLATVTDCYTTTAIHSGPLAFAIGGIIGEDYRSAITQCYTGGTVSVDDANSYAVDPVLGDSYKTTGADCYHFAPNAIVRSNQAWSQPLTAEQMKRQASFVGWDFDEVWMICEGQDYPRLRWEGVDCQE
jgi:hypothetical protein